MLRLEYTLLESLYLMVVGCCMKTQAHPHLDGRVKLRDMKAVIVETYQQSTTPI